MMKKGLNIKKVVSNLQHLADSFYIRANKDPRAIAGKPAGTYHKFYRFGYIVHAYNMDGSRITREDYSALIARYYDDHPEIIQEYSIKIGQSIDETYNHLVCNSIGLYMARYYGEQYAPCSVCGSLSPNPPYCCAKPKEDIYR